MKKTRETGDELSLPYLSSWSTWLTSKKMKLGFQSDQTSIYSDIWSLVDYQTTPIIEIKTHTHSGAKWSSSSRSHWMDTSPSWLFLPWWNRDDTTFPPPRSYQSHWASPCFLSQTRKPATSGFCSPKIPNLGHKHGLMSAHVHLILDASKIFAPSLGLPPRLATIPLGSPDVVSITMMFSLLFCSPSEPPMTPLELFGSRSILAYSWTPFASLSPSVWTFRLTFTMLHRPPCCIQHMHITSQETH